MLTHTMRTKMEGGKAGGSLILLITVLLVLGSKGASAQKQAKALLKWKNSLKSHTLLSTTSSWSPVNRSSSITGTGRPCSWIGIRCNEVQNVVEINFANADIEGTLEKFDFSAFPNLKLFNLSSNKLSGSLPTEIGTLSKLFYLELSCNSFEGTVPGQIGNLSKLQKLNLSHNQLSGELESQLFHSSTVLYELNMSSNYLSGQIPLQIGTLTHLRTLDLSTNNLKGRISPAVGVLTSLQTLNLSNNSLSGSIPMPLQGLISLQNVDLSYNHLQGQVPDISIFNQASPKAFAGNADLCSAKLVGGLQPCDHVKSLPTNPSNTLERILIIVIPLSCSFLLLLILGGALHIGTVCQASKKKELKMFFLLVGPLLYISM